MLNKKILILDYGLGNIGSLCNALTALGFDWHVSCNADQANQIQFDNLILPGVGSYEAGINGLSERGFSQSIVRWITEGKKILGICLGMQLLLTSSDEGNCSKKGLDLIKGKVIELPNLELPKPHIGWSSTYSNKKITKDNQPELSLSGDFYYIHSYVAKPENNENIIAFFNYGESKQTAAIANKNVYGVQFHPEKSQSDGLKFLKEFLLLKSLL